MHIGGLPYFTKEPAKIEGFGDPLARVPEATATGDVSMLEGLYQGLQGAGIESQ